MQNHPFAQSQAKTRNKTWLLSGLVVLGGLSLLIFYFYSSGRGELIILDTDPGLEITLNNRSVPVKSTSEGYSIPAFAGTYRIGIKKTNYLPFIQDIQLNRGERLRLRPAYSFQPTSQQAQAPGVSFVRPSGDGKSVFYLGDNGKTIYRMEVGNQSKVALTERPLFGVKDVQWSEAPNVALVTRTDGVYLHEIPKFDFTNQAIVRLGGSEIGSPIWHPLDTDKIAFAYQPSSGEKSLVISDKRLVNLDRKQDISNLKNPKLFWSSDAKYILLINRSSDYATNQLWIFDTTNGTYRKITSRGSIVNASFSPKNDTILYEDQTSNLYSVSVDGTRDNSLKLTGRITATSWKDATSFYVPDQKNNQLHVYKLDGNKSTLSFNFPKNIQIQGTYYFPDSKTLIFYSNESIYTINLAL